MLIELENVSKIYNQGKPNEVKALTNVTLTISPSRFLRTEKDFTPLCETRRKSPGCLVSSYVTRWPLDSGNGRPSIRAFEKQNFFMSAAQISLGSHRGRFVNQNWTKIS